MDLGRIVVSQFAIIRIILEATQSAFTCSKLTTKTPERRQWRRSCVFIANLEHISHLVLLLTLNM